MAKRSKKMTIEDLSLQIKTVSQTVEDLSLQVKTVSQSVEDLAIITAKGFKDTREEMSAGFDKVDKKFEALEE